MRQGRLSGIAIILALTVGLVLAGCGSSSTDSSGSTTTTTTTTIAAAPTTTTTTAAATRTSVASTNATNGKFLAKANAICNTSNEMIEVAAKKSLPSNKKTKPTQVQLLRYAKLVKRALLAQIKGIRALPAPPGDKAGVTNMLSLIGGDLEKVQAEPALLAKPEMFANFAKLADSYGLTSCVPKSVS